MLAPVVTERSLTRKPAPKYGTCTAESAVLPWVLDVLRARPCVASVRLTGVTERGADRTDTKSCARQQPTLRPQCKLTSTSVRAWEVFAPFMERHADVAEPPPAASLVVVAKGVLELAGAIFNAHLVGVLFVHDDSVRARRLVL